MERNNDNILDNDTDILSLLDIMLDFRQDVIDELAVDEHNTKDFTDNENLDYNNNDTELTNNQNNNNDIEILSNSQEQPAIADVEPSIDDISPDDDFWLDDYEDYCSSPIGIEDLFGLI